MAAACSDDADSADGSGGGTDAGDPSDLTATTDESSTTASSGSTSSSTTAGTATSSASTSTTSGPASSVSPGGTFPDDELPGQSIDLFVEEGDELAVIGVADDDELNLRAKPGTDQDVLAALSPTADGLEASGRARQLPSSIWFEVSVGGQTGWVSSAFVSYLGLVDDATAEYLDLVGEAPSAETMTALGAAVAQEFASDDPPSTIVQTVAPTVGDLGEVTYDVVGIGDDAVRGFRLHIFAFVDEGDEAFTLRTIERTTLCTRGLAGELCT